MSVAKYVYSPNHRLIKKKGCASSNKRRWDVGLVVGGEAEGCKWLRIGLIVAGHSTMQN